MELWTAVGLALGIASIAVSLGIAYGSRRPKRLDYQVTTNTRLLSPTAYETSGVRGDLFSYREQKLGEPRLVVVRVLNSGKVPIAPEDFVRPLTISVGDQAVVATKGVSGSEPADLAPTLDSLDEHSVTVEPVLLNAGEWFDIQLLIDGSGH